MKTYWETLTNVWNKTTAKTKRDERLVYVGDIVEVIKGRKVPIGTIGKVIEMIENKYNPITYDMAKGALNLQAAGVNIDAIQMTNAIIKLELKGGTMVYTYLRNVKKFVHKNKKNLFTKCKNLLYNISIRPPERQKLKKER